MSGRAGRGETPGRVILQTYNPGHYSLVCAAGHDYLRFHRLERETRLAAGYPPFTDMVRIGLTGPEEEATWRAARELSARIRASLGLTADAGDKTKGTTEILGPTSALIKRVEDRYRFHLLVKTPNLAAIGAELARVVSHFRDERGRARIAVILDVNPNTVL